MLVDAVRHAITPSVTYKPWDASENLYRYLFAYCSENLRMVSRFLDCLGALSAAGAPSSVSEA